MGIFVKTLTGKTVQLEVGEVQIGPRREDGSFRLRATAEGIDMQVLAVNIPEPT